MNLLNEVLREQAIRYGLCEQWTKEWSENWSRQKMVDKFFEGIDFCIEHNYPENGFIKKHFELDFLRNNGIYVDDTYSAINKTCAAVYGQSDATLRYNSLKSGRIWVKDMAKLHVISHNFSFAIIHAFDQCVITAEAYDKSNIVVIIHSDQVALNKQGKVTVKEEIGYLR